MAYIRITLTAFLILNASPIWGVADNSGTNLRCVELFSTRFPYPEYLGHFLQTPEGDTLTLIDIGNRQELVDQPLLEKELLSQTFEANEVTFGGAKAKAAHELGLLQLKIQRKMFELYRQTKGYLSEWDFLDLKHAWSLGYVSNTYLLLGGRLGSSPRESIDAGDIQATISLFRSTRFFPWPQSIKPAHDNALFKALTPCFFRFDTQHKGHFEIPEALSKKVAGKKVGEISRYGHFGKVDARANAVMLKRILDDAKDPSDPLDLLIIRTDSKTSRAFALAYGFSDPILLPSKNSSEPEYLYFLEVGSPRFTKTYNKLDQLASGVLVTAVDPK